MAYEIIWTAEASSGFHQIIMYLEKEWTEREIVRFVNRTHEKIALLTQHPAIGRLHNSRRKVYITLLTRHTSLVYHVRPLKKEIVLLSFWDNRRNPREGHH